jgi:nickel/cobalt exporter
MKTTHWATGFLAGAVLLALLHPSFAQSSLGIGTAEPSIEVSGPFASLFQWINTQQQAFYRSLTDALKAIRDDGAKMWLLVGLSFAYGVFHAAGPGHGKAVISSYMLANEVALRRGVALSFVSAFVQAITAIVVVATVFLFLRGTSISMSDATRFLEVTSFALIAAFGAWLLWKKLRQIMVSSRPAASAHSLSAASTADHFHAHDHHQHCGHAHHHHEHHDHGADCGCGHSHAPDPAMLSGEKLDWKTGWSAVAAVGMRPCSGALIVLTFAFLNGLWLGGIVSVFAMAAGTAITVSLLATLAVFAKNRAVAFAGGVKWGERIHHGIEISGALFVLVLGLLLLGASLSA